MMQLTRRGFLTAAAGLAVTGLGQAQESRKPNVLFIAVDDLRPLLGCYGVPWVQTPNIDRLAARGAVFTRAYCQDSVCSPSRTSVLTGLRPDTTRIYDNATHFRVYNPEAVTLPQHFRAHGYHTQAAGKIYHSCFEEAYVGRTLDDPPSWSAPAWFAPPQYYHTEEGMRVARDVYARRPNCAFGSGCIHNRLQEPAPEGSVDRSPAALDRWKEHFIQGELFEAPDVPDDVPHDGQVATRAVGLLEERAGSGQPWFLAVGFMKPHTPYVAPKKYWDLYDPALLPLVDQEAPVGASPLAILAQHDHLAYSGAPGEGRLDDATARKVVHGYAACVSYMDAQVGRVLDALEALGQAQQTTVVFWGDHGFHLGEQGRWGKQTCYETGTRAPLIIAAPGTPAGERRGLAELLDIYPTLCEVAGLPIPGALQGQSLLPALEQPGHPGKSAAFSQFPNPVRVSAPEIKPQPGDTMGNSVRTDRYRLTIWRDVLSPHQERAVELFDYEQDPLERNNLAQNPAYADPLQMLRNHLTDLTKA